MENVSFSHIYKLYYRRSFLFVKSFVRDEMAAEDIVSEALINLWHTIKKEEVENTFALLVTILRNDSLNYLKHLARKETAMEKIASDMERDFYYKISSLEAFDPEEVFSVEITQIIEKTLQRLPPQTRKIFELSRYQQKSIKEIAEEMSMNPRSVDYHITKSLKELRIALKDYLPIFYLLFGI